MGHYEEFVKFRQEMNKKILEQGTLEIKRFFGLDEQTYRAGALDEKTKELMGLVASMVLRCDDCISYHLIQALDKGATQEEIFETFSIGLVVGGSIVIPHLRRAVAFLEELKAR
ncbi:MAG: carboxymuconolactone decarboxylase family protein [Candidatus Saccharicenans sp.]|nr:MAG: carboxymuconolactone decarboxylase family protein [Candidatus Aminicenantes bacterium]HEK85735.1 carboxymuconolactone decarboxylase family protein [Candidatus Aminicenantes bacterium]